MARTQHHALDIPEIITLILSYCNLHSLRIQTSLINRQWYTLSQELIDQQKYITHFNYASPPLSSLLAPSLRKSFHLQCKGNLDIISTGCLEDWGILHGVLSNLHEEEHGLKRLKEVDFRGQFDFEDTLYPMLPCFGHIRVLRLFHGCPDGNMDLGIIMRSCPELTDLIVKRNSSAPQRWAYSYVGLEISSTGEGETLPVNKLRRLELEYVNLEQEHLFWILKVSPELQALRLGQIKSLVAEQDFDHFLLIDQLQKSCPRLSSLLLSFRPINDQARERITHSELVMALTRFLPKVTDWSFAGYDFVETEDVPNWYRHFVLHHPLRALEITPNHLTSLEIVGQIHPNHQSAIQESLQHFLCSSPHLIHFRAPNVQYSAKFFNVDMEDALLIPFGEAAEEASSSMRGKTRYRPWACHQLQTLYLQWDLPALAYPLLFQADHTSIYLQPQTQREYFSRMLFGYLVRVCPLLRDVEIYHNQLVNLAALSGFSLLSGLKDLEHLVVKDFSNSTTKVLEEDFVWMGRGRGTMTLLEREQQKNVVRQLKVLAREEDVRLASLAGRTPRLESLMKKTSVWGDRMEREENALGWQHYGRIWDIVQVLQARLDQEETMAFWPRLETLMILWAQDGSIADKQLQQELRSILCKRRPDIQCIVCP